MISLPKSESLPTHSGIHLNEYCFDAILNEIDSSHQIDQTLLKENPVTCMFVTWRKQSQKSTPETPTWDLRGCIGSFTPSKLKDLIGKMSKRSAFEDKRFKPIGVDEIKLLKNDVSLLSQLEEAKGLDDWKIGEHGLLIAFQSKGQKFSSTFLPDVIEQQGWTKKKTIQALCEKAGYRGKIEDAKEVVLMKYKSYKSSMSFEEYLASKEKKGLKVSTKVQIKNSK